LEGFLLKVTAGLGRAERRRWAGVYVRVLLLDGERKSVEPMAARLGQSDQDLQHFVSQRPWPADLLLEALTSTTASVLPAYWVIDETSFPKAGRHSVGVQRQYCGALGKKANCQIAVSLRRADEENGTSQPLGWRLYLPESWTEDPKRCQPPEVVHRSKLDLALGPSIKPWAGTCPQASCLPTRRMSYFEIALKDPLGGSLVHRGYHGGLPQNCSLMPC
jgi:SRSO17 transposase